MVKSCEAEKEAEKKEYERICAVLKEEHTAQLSKLSDPDEIKDEKYVYKNKLYDQNVRKSKTENMMRFYISII